MPYGGEYHRRRVGLNFAKQLLSVIGGVTTVKIATTANEILEPLKKTVYQELSDFDVLQEANRCLFCYDAPCIKACPTHIDVPSFIRKITTGNMTGSARVIFDANPMGASCARVCPTEDLCEGACVLSEESHSIRIGDLQRYVTDWVRERDISLFVAGPSTGKTVAIVGAGPAGLSTARDLARYGHKVTLFELREQLGGLNTYGIVPFRLPAEIPLWEAAQVTHLGVNANTGSKIGVDISLQALVDSYDAVVLAFGMGSVPRLNIPGEDLHGVWDAIDFVDKVKRGEDVGVLGERVGVIGAGNTAIDAATCSRRLGVPHVTLYYRRGEQHMSAYKFEYEFAKQERVEYRWYSTPKRILGEGGRVTGVEFVKTRLDSDGMGGMRPIAMEGSEYIEPMDTVIRAIGQSRLSAMFQLDSIGVATRAGVVVVDDQFRTSNKKVFAAGDCTFTKGQAEAMVVEAAQQGKLAAASIHEYLSQ